MPLSVRPGDVLIWKLGRRTNIFGHAGIVWSGESKTWQIEAAGGVIAKSDLGTGPEPNYVYQCDDPLLAAEAASVAHVWSMGKRDHNDPKQAGITGGRALGTQSFVRDKKVYGKKAAVGSAFILPIFGRNAKTRAQSYRQHSNSIAAPPSFRESAGETDLFCSMLVVAAYQGASAGDGECNTYMKLDAKHTTPVDLSMYLWLNRHWSWCKWSNYD